MSNGIGLQRVLQSACQCPSTAASSLCCTDMALIFRNHETTSPSLQEIHLQGFARSLFERELFWALSLWVGGKPNSDAIITSICDHI